MRKYFVFKAIIGDTNLFILFNTLEDAQQFKEANDKKNNLLSTFANPIEYPTSAYPYPYIFFNKKYDKKIRHNAISEKKFSLLDCYVMLFYDDINIPHGNYKVINQSVAQYENNHHDAGGFYKLKVTENYPNFDFKYVYIKPVILYTRIINKSDEFKFGKPEAAYQQTIPHSYSKFISTEIQPLELRQKLIQLFEDYYRPFKFYYLGETLSRLFTCHMGRHKKNLILAKELVNELKKLKDNDYTAIFKLIWSMRGNAFQQNEHAPDSYGNENFNPEGSFLRRLNYALITSYEIVSNKKNISIRLGTFPENVNLSEPDGEKKLTGSAPWCGVKTLIRG